MHKKGRGAGLERKVSLVLNMFILVDQRDLLCVWFRVGSVSVKKFSGAELTAGQKI